MATAARNRAKQLELAAAFLTEQRAVLQAANAVAMRDYAREWLR